MSYAELFDVMSDLSLSALEAKRFGKKRAHEAQQKKDDACDGGFQESNHRMQKEEALDSTSKLISSNSNDPRYIPKVLKYQVWQRDKGACTNCGSQRNIQYDHIHPVALGGSTTLKNLRLRCFHCNQRSSTKIFGVYEKRAEISRI